MLADIHKTGVSAGLSIADYSDVQAAATEILKIDGDAVVINTIMMHEIFAQAADKFFHLLIGRVVGQSQHKIKPSFFTFAEIGDGRVGEQGVGDIDKFLWKSTQTSAAESDFFYSAFDAVSRDPVADHKRFVNDDDQTAEYVGQRIFSG